jgi:hypothetical protein
VTDQPTADRIRAAIADAVTINAGPLIDHAASGVLYALGLAEVPPADGAPGPLTRVTDHTHTGPREACNTSRFGETCGQPATEHQLHDGADPLPVSTCPRTDRHGYHLWPDQPGPAFCPGHPAPEPARTAPDNPAVEHASEPNEPGTAASDDGLHLALARIASDRAHHEHCARIARTDEGGIAHSSIAAGLQAAEVHLRAALDGHAGTTPPAVAEQPDPETINDWCDPPPADPEPVCTATLRMFETVIRCTQHRPGIHRGPLPNSASTHAWGDYAPGATPHSPDAEAQPFTPPPPGSTAEQLPADTLALLDGYISPYRSTACDTAGACERACRQAHPHMIGLLQRAETLHARCRLNHKFTGQLCTCGCHTITEETQ